MTNQVSHPRFVEHKFQDTVEGKKERYSYIVDTTSGFIYNGQDSHARIQKKCKKCAIGTPFVTVARAISGLVRGIFNFFKAFGKIGKYVSGS